MYVAHRQMREDQILEQLQDGEPKTSWQIMENIYGDSIDKRLRRAADGNVQAHLKSLQKSGVVRASRGEKKRPNPATVAKNKAKDKADRKIIQQGKTPRQSPADQNPCPTGKPTHRPLGRNHRRIS